MSSISRPATTAGSSATSRGRPMTSRACGRSAAPSSPTTGSLRPSCSPTWWTRRRPPRGWATPAGARRSRRPTSAASSGWTAFGAGGQDDRRRAPGPLRQFRAGSPVRPRRASDRPADWAGPRAGVHTGEVELSARRCPWSAVHVASRIMGLAGEGEVYVSGTTHELIGGSSLAFEDRGEHELKGVSGPTARIRSWFARRPDARLEAVSRLQGHEPDQDQQPDRPDPAEDVRDPRVEVARERLVSDRRFTVPPRRAAGAAACSTATRPHTSLRRPRVSTTTDIQTQGCAHSPLTAAAPAPPTSSRRSPT